MFYDLDTPVTLSRLHAGEPVPYLLAEGLGGFDLVLSFTGGTALDLLTSQLGARRVAPLYGSVDPVIHHPVAGDAAFRCDLSYPGTYAADRQAKLQALFIDAAEQAPDRKFLLAGAMYPGDFPWQANVHFMPHLAPAEHAKLFCSSRLTLNITRLAMAELGFCPSGRLFEAAACGAPILSDTWEGLEQFFTPGEQILVGQQANDTLAALSLSDAELGRIARNARQRVMDEHTADRRAEELELMLGDSLARSDGVGEPVPDSVRH